MWHHQLRGAPPRRLSCCCTDCGSSNTADMTPRASPCCRTPEAPRRCARSATSPLWAPPSPGGWRCRPGSSVRARRPNGAGARWPGTTTGIGHTRWATHGGVTEANAHPHADSDERIHIVLNGIIENHSELRRWMVAEGAVIRSETDAEVVAHLIAHHDHGDLAEAVAATLAHLRRPLRDSSPCRPITRGCSSAPAGTARWWWGSPTTVTSSPRRSPRSSPTRGEMHDVATASSSSPPPTASSSSTPRPARRAPRR